MSFLFIFSSALLCLRLFCRFFLCRILCFLAVRSLKLCHLFAVCIENAYTVGIRHKLISLFGKGFIILVLIFFCSVGVFSHKVSYGFSLAVHLGLFAVISLYLIIFTIYGGHIGKLNCNRRLILSITASADF